MNPYEKFRRECAEEIERQENDERLAQATREWMAAAVATKYSYHFEWLGRPVIQYPQDLLVMQEIIWSLKPDLIVETGIAHGGSLIFWASILELNAACGGPGDAEVVGVDIDIRAHNRAAIEAHPMAKRIRLLQGSSVDPAIVARVCEAAKGKRCVLVCLDSMHTHEHVLAELEAYAPLVTVGSYCVVFDTIIEHYPKSTYMDRPWGPGDNPKTAARAYLERHPEFSVDKSIQNKILITVAPDGYLRRVG